MLKRIFIATLFLIFFLLPQSIYASTQEEIIQRVSSDTEIFNNLETEMDAVKNDPSAILQIIIRDSPSMIQHWNESSAFYESAIATEENGEIKAILTNIDTNVKGLSTSLSALEDSIATGDEDAYSNASDQYYNSMKSINTQIDLLNSHFGVADYSWLAWPFWVSLIISIYLFIISRGNPVLPAEQLRNKFEFALFKSSLWPLGGSAISYFWFLGTPPGGTFYLLWGPIGIGFFQFFKGLYAYITLARPAINLAKKEQQAKLEALITSDKFQKESLEEQVKDIEKRSPFIHLGKKDK